jgi:hypothetical protein
MMKNPDIPFSRPGRAEGICVFPGGRTSGEESRYPEE